MNTTKAKDIDEYIARYPEDVQKKLEQVRAAIKIAAPDAEEVIKYDTPTFTLKRNLVSFAAYQNHIGLYPIPAGDKAFEKDIAVYKAGKSTLRFPLNEPIPVKLVTKIAELRVKSLLEKAEKKNNDQSLI